MSQFPPPIPPSNPVYSTPNPPVVPGALGDGFVDLPGWPKPVGIISIVWASLGLVCGVCGVVSQVMQDAMMNMIPQPPAGAGGGAPAMGPMPEVMKPTAVEIGFTAFGLLVSGMLLFAGIMLLQRKMTSRLLHLAYAVISVFTTLITVFLMLSKQAAIQEWAKQNPGDFWAQTQQGGGNIGAVIGIGFAVLFGLAYPLFCIVWFGFIKTKPEQYGAGMQREQF